MNLSIILLEEYRYTKTRSSH